MTIKLLPQDIVLKIAAGEVIERPGSVVKELLENSLDAKSTKIEIEISDESIKITDNGFGMSEEDLDICYYRHSTSKIKEAEDLFNIKSLGFRGEALASIAAVSLMKITSKKANESNANSIIIEGGNKISKAKAPFPFDSGTQIEVNNIFFNTPARKKYMKNESTENRFIAEIVNNYMLSNDEVSFKLIINNKIILNVPEDANLKERLYSIYGKETKEMLILDELNSDELNKTKIELIEKGIKINGMISKPNIYRKSRNDIILFVNNRLIKSGIICSAISNAYKGFLNTGEYPLCVLKIYINSDKIDVNVHPTKQEIKFEEEKLVYKAIYYTIKDSLLASDLSRQKEIPLDFKQTKIFENNLIQETKKEFKSEKNKTKEYSDQTIIKDNSFLKENSIYSDLIDKKENHIRIIGIYNKEFVIAENLDSEKLILVDFHAASEIRNYEILKGKFENEGIECQSLISSEVVEMNLKHYEIVLENIDSLKKMGFVIEDFGNQSILLRTVPLILGKNFDKNLFFELIQEIENENKNKLIEEIKDKIIMRMACRMSEKSGDNITIPIAEKIISNMFKNKGNYFNCPHGRPTFIEIEKRDVEKMFKRIR